MIDTWTATGVAFVCSESGAGRSAGTWRPNTGLSTEGLSGKTRFIVLSNSAVPTTHVALTTNSTSADLFRQINRRHDTDFGTKSQDPPRGTLH